MSIPRAWQSLAGQFVRFERFLVFLFCSIFSIPSIGIIERISIAPGVQVFSVVKFRQLYIP
ncbi:TPA: hypothetical protein DEG21_01100 [Patescibacteria group bacterium]|nr:hypothetical protein [Candidatus Gracilibacteria bacterium]HBY74502.1 hypothetical protein [Candidatus Gracilibacteria bacterium]